jgi:hypothetical protein
MVEGLRQPGRRLQQVRLDVVARPDREREVQDSERESR